MPEDASDTSMPQRATGGSAPEKSTRSVSPDPKTSAGKITQIYYLILSTILLVAVISLTILFASGVLDFGLEGPFVFILYVISGILVSVACFGLLSSSGEIVGESFGYKTRIGGAIVGLVVVVGGGGIYEVFARPASLFSFRILMYEDTPASPTLVKGSVSLIVGAAIRSADVDSNGTALFQGLPARWVETPAQLILRSNEFLIADPKSNQIVLKKEATLRIKIKRKNIFTSYKNSKLKIKIGSVFSDKLASGGRTVTLSLLVLSESERPVPVYPTATVHLTRAGLGIRSLEMNLNDGTLAEVIVINPRVPKTLKVDGKLPEDYKDLLGMDLEAYVSIKYYDPKVSVSGKFHSNSIPFTRNKLGID